jgi:cytochrome o ubiquinol oxidase subunit 3
MSTAAAGTIDHHRDPTTSTGIPNKKLLMWAFLASDCMFFGCLISTHLIYRLHPPPGVPAARDVFNIELTSFSTFILLMSSLMMALAVNAIQKGNLRSLRASILTTVLFGSIFLGCQVYEFHNFVYEKHLTITNSILGTTFFTLTGTHGTHVAVGVLWLVLMYIRSFKPAGAEAAKGTWLLFSFAHLVVFAATLILTGYVVLGVARAGQADGFNLKMIGTYAGAQYPALIATLIGFLGLRWFALPRGEVDFDQRNAVDVEMMGLYWHFVDIVWIVIFTAVYLLEYIS